jgi:hypothetical protein
MRLKTGDLAIPFSVETIEGKTLSLNDLTGKPVLLMFFRYGSCPMCNLRLRDFAQHYVSLHERVSKWSPFFIHRLAVFLQMQARGTIVFILCQIHNSRCTEATGWRLRG